MISAILTGCFVYAVCCGVAAGAIYNVLTRVRKARRG